MFAVFLSNPSLSFLVSLIANISTTTTTRSLEYVVLDRGTKPDQQEVKEEDDDDEDEEFIIDDEIRFVASQFITPHPELEEEEDESDGGVEQLSIQDLLSQAIGGGGSPPSTARPPSRNLE